MSINTIAFLYNIKCKKYYWKFYLGLSKSSSKEFFPNKVTVSRSANNKKLLQKNFSRTKFKVFYLASSENLFFGLLSTETVVQRCSVKKVFLEISLNS